MTQQEIYPKAMLYVRKQTSGLTTVYDNENFKVQITESDIADIVTQFCFDITGLMKID